MYRYKKKLWHLFLFKRSWDERKLQTLVCSHISDNINSKGAKSTEVNLYYMISLIEYVATLIMLTSGFNRRRKVTIIKSLKRIGDIPLEVQMRKYLKKISNKNKLSRVKAMCGTVTHNCPSDHRTMDFITVSEQNSQVNWQASKQSSNNQEVGSH